MPAPPDAAWPAVEPDAPHLSAATCEALREIEIVDPLVVRFHLKEPWPDFMTFYGTTATAAGIVVPGRRIRLRTESEACCSGRST